MRLGLEDLSIPARSGSRDPMIQHHTFFLLKFETLGSWDDGLDLWPFLARTLGNSYSATSTGPKHLVPVMKAIGGRSVVVQVLTT